MADNVKFYRAADAINIAKRVEFKAVHYTPSTKLQFMACLKAL